MAQKENDGAIYGVKDIFLNGVKLGLISEDGLQPGGDSPTKTRIWAAQKRNAPFLVIKSTPGSKNWTFTMIEMIPFDSWSPLVVMLVGGLICYFLSNFISNSAAANLVVPILVVVGTAMKGSPAFEALGGLPAMIIGIAIAASVAMCLPVSTPPNALAHSTGMITTKQMATMGIILGVIGLGLGYLMLIFVGF